VLVLVLVVPLLLLENCTPQPLIDQLRVMVMMGALPVEVRATTIVAIVAIVTIVAVVAIIADVIVIVVIVVAATAHMATAARQWR
jgi:hypothetical protein